MSEHKFTYTVSGVNLSNEQKTAISQAIAAVVAEVLMGDDPGGFRADSLVLHRIYGGIWQRVADLEQFEKGDPLAVQLPKLAGGVERG
ncbi:MAG: hypothetical protein P4L64_00665 [Caulobacteraceae bacterium]|nr:hypothetical protein [Caulobacteraceae bacterium]